VRTPPDEERQHWDRPDIWDGQSASDDEIVVPNGRPIYALIVAGYSSNAFLDQMMLYNFARHLMSKGAYVHYSWWNNLLAPYMERPLHSLQSYPGEIGVTNLFNFRSGEAANKKALPGEDYQFLSDAKRLLTAIRQNNPNAIIIVAGHSMGGCSVVHLGAQASELIDILAPIDPVGNRNFPWAGALRITAKDYNWTRWRASRDNFLGYTDSYNAGTIISPDCQSTGPWLRETPAPTTTNLLCGFFIDDDAPVVTFGSNVVNLYHRYQDEAKFPYDYDKAYHFGHSPRRPNSFSIQSVIATLSDGADPDGWPNINSVYSCCPGESGVAWPADGHEEIIGNRGATNYDLGILPIPLGTRLRTSAYCGVNCTTTDHWPGRGVIIGTWSIGDSALRTRYLRELETLPLTENWFHRPARPQLCKVSQGLINLFDAMNKPPTANAGNNLLAECNSNNNATVTLDGSASTDPDNDELVYSWSGSFGTRTGKIVSVTLPVGTHCITLTIEDPSGHIDKSKVSVTVQDKIGPVVNVSLTPSLLWPPNHKFVEINATVNAVDACGTVESIVLYSIVASEGANIIGSGNTSPDIIEANYDTHDLVFKLRAERSGPNRRRIYTVTYKATDNAGNSTFQSAEVVVENPSQ